MPQASEATVNSVSPARKEPAVAVQVAEPAAQQQKAAEGQHVGIDHPDQRGLGEMQVGAYGRQGHVDDGGVEHDHQHPEAQHHQGPPALAAVHVLFSFALLLCFIVDECGPSNQGRFWSIREKTMPWPRMLRHRP
jgi:hypothetical protein